MRRHATVSNTLRWKSWRRNLRQTMNGRVNIIRGASVELYESENQTVRLQPPPCNRMASRKRRRLVEKAGIKETPPSSNRPPFFYLKIDHLARPKSIACPTLVS